MIDSLLTAFCIVYSVLLDFTLFCIDTFLPQWLSDLVLCWAKKDHFAPQPTRFDGYYLRVQTPDKGSLVVIFSSIPNADSSTKHYVHFSLHPTADAEAIPNVGPLRVDMYPEDMHYAQVDNTDAEGQESFRLQADDFGAMFIRPDRQTYRLSLPDPTREDSVLAVDIDITHRTPLKGSDALYTPHGRWVRLGNLLPIHWHIFSTCSIAKYVISRDGKVLTEGTGVAHLEKNWGRGFPKGWTWPVCMLTLRVQLANSPLSANRMQAFSEANTSSLNFRTQAPSTLAVAGGNILNGKAYMIVYRSPLLRWEFSPPWTVLASCGMDVWLPSPFFSEWRHPNRPEIELDVRTFTRRLVIKATGPKDPRHWMSLSCPLFDGHALETAKETFTGRITVEAYTRPYISFICPWKLNWWKVDSRVFEHAAFELGGGYTHSLQSRGQNNGLEARPVV